MIGRLEGIVDVQDGQWIIIDVHGVGYKVFVPISVSSKSTNGEQIKLYIHTHVKDDAIDLYGFIDYLDLKLFELLIGVSGIGPKTVMGIFSIGDRESIIDAITKGDTTFFSGVPRLGTKNAQKIIIELRNKLGSIGNFELFSPENDEIITALQGFGFSQKEAQEAVRTIGTNGATTEEKIKMALKYLGK